ncbi:MULTISPECIES: hypothetical protein [unclassified Candidatus Tisiphia]|uniref:hypothetical protein n=1 Tax=unclassified Candidatus Tisiphia TaxID=2996318 RepID=UPI0035C88D64
MTIIEKCKVLCIPAFAVTITVEIHQVYILGNIYFARLGEYKRILKEKAVFKI